MPFSEFLDNPACRTKIVSSPELEQRQRERAAKNKEFQLKILESFEAEYKKGSRPRGPLKEAFSICIKNNLPLPLWVADGMFYLLDVPSLDRLLLTLEKAYQAENYGALKDAVYWCRSYDQPLPEWANLALFDSLNALTIDNKDTLKKWRTWGKQYRQDMADLDVYEWVLDSREHGAEWKDVYDIAGSIISNKIDEDGGAKSDTIIKAYKRVVRRMKERPLRYYQLKTYMKGRVNREYNFDLWVWVKETIKAGKPKGIKKSMD
jgi:hypothetical protein